MLRRVDLVKFSYCILRFHSFIHVENDATTRCVVAACRDDRGVAAPKVVIDVPRLLPFYIRRDKELKDHGATLGCLGCDAFVVGLPPVGHSEAC